MDIDDVLKHIRKASKSHYAQDGDFTLSAFRSNLRKWYCTKSHAELDKFSLHKEFLSNGLFKLQRKGCDEVSFHYDFDKQKIEYIE